MWRRGASNELLKGDKGVFLDSFFFLGERGVTSDMRCCQKWVNGVEERKKKNVKKKCRTGVLSCRTTLECK